MIMIMIMIHQGIGVACRAAAVRGAAAEAARLTDI
jgi:hypothetical protein